MHLLKTENWLEYKRLWIGCENNSQGGKKVMLHWADLAFSAPLYWSQIAERVHKIKRIHEAKREWGLETTRPENQNPSPTSAGSSSSSWAVRPPLGPSMFSSVVLEELGPRCFERSLLTLKCHNARKRTRIRHEFLPLLKMSRVAETVTSL